MLSLTLGFFLVAQSGTPAALADISLTPRMQRPMEKPQIARDLEGLEATEGGFSQGLRGSFVVKHYVSGPWKGGTAVIEVASDLSYAEIRIFDRDGTLQRIYSVQPKSEKTHINPAHIKNPLKMVEQVNADDAAQTHSHASTVTRSPQREAAVQEQTARAVRAQEADRDSTSDSRSISGLLGQGHLQADNGSVSGLLESPTHRARAESCLSASAA